MALAAAALMLTLGPGPAGGAMSANPQIIPPNEIAGTVKFEIKLDSPEGSWTETLTTNVTFVLSDKLSKANKYREWVYTAHGSTVWESTGEVGCQIQGGPIEIPLNQESQLFIAKDSTPEWVAYGYKGVISPTLETSVHLTCQGTPAGEIALKRDLWWPSPELSYERAAFGGPLKGSGERTISPIQSWSWDWKLSGSPWEELAPLVPLVPKSKTIKVPKNGVISFPLVAPGAVTSTGSGTVNVNAAAGGSKKSANGALLGSARFQIAAGQRTTSARIVLNATGRKLVSQRHSVRAICNIVPDAKSRAVIRATSTPIVLIG